MARYVRQLQASARGLWPSDKAFLALGQKTALHAVFVVVVYFKQFLVFSSNLINFPINLKKVY